MKKFDVANVYDEHVNGRRLGHLVIYQDRRPANIYYDKIIAREQARTEVLFDIILYIMDNVKSIASADEFDSIATPVLDMLKEHEFIDNNNIPDEFQSIARLSIDQSTGMSIDHVTTDNNNTYIATDLFGTMADFVARYNELAFKYGE